MVNKPLLFLDLPFVMRYEEVSFLSIAYVSEILSRSFGEDRIGGYALCPTPSVAWSSLFVYV